MIGALRRCRLLLPALIVAVIIVSTGFTARSGSEQPAPNPSMPSVHSPHAALTGMFEPGARDGAGAPPDTVIGRILLDASGSRSDRPIRWKWAGPGPSIILVPQNPADGPGHSIAIAYVSAPGTYRFVAVARGQTDGEPDADAAMFVYTVGGGAVRPLPAPAPGPNPQPVQPTPTPAPRPFPSASQQGSGRLINRNS